MPTYIVVRSPDMFTFEQQVQLKMQEGYRPIGGLVIAQDSNHGSVYHQAMIL